MQVCWLRMYCISVLLFNLRSLQSTLFFPNINKWSSHSGFKLSSFITTFSSCWWLMLWKCNKEPWWKLVSNEGHVFVCFPHNASQSFWVMPKGLLPLLFSSHLFVFDVSEFSVAKYAFPGQEMSSYKLMDHKMWKGISFCSLTFFLPEMWWAAYNFHIWKKVRPMMMVLELGHSVEESEYYFISLWIASLHLKSFFLLFLLQVHFSWFWSHRLKIGGFCECYFDNYSKNTSFAPLIILSRETH